MEALVFAQKHQEQAPKTPKRFYTCLKPRGPVFETTLPVAVYTSTEKRGFVTSKFWALRTFAHRHMITGGMSLSARLTTCLQAWFQHPVHLMRLKPLTVGYFDSPVGIKTMTTITQQAHRAATPATSSIPTSNISAVLAAFNAANMAASYVERGNFAAARRKLTQALASINQITLEA